MNPTRALEIIDLLAGGVDPIHGEVFPPESPLQHPDVVRALFMAATFLRSAGVETRRSPTLVPNDAPANAGKSWSQKEDQELVSAYELGATEKELAEKHKRTRGAVRSRLTKLGKLEPYGISATPHDHED